MPRPTASRIGSLRGSDFVVGWVMTSTRKSKKQLQADERSPEETERIREVTLKKLLSTPPKPHKDMVAERKAKRGGRGKQSGKTS
jgi:hypothetical protein